MFRPSLGDDSVLNACYCGRPATGTPRRAGIKSHSGSLRGGRRRRINLWGTPLLARGGFPGKQNVDGFTWRRNIILYSLSRFGMNEPFN